MPEKNKIKYGLSNVAVWPIDSVDTDGKPTYGTVIKVPGAVTLTMDAEESADPFYADNVVYFMAQSNNGYSGTLEIALTPEEFYEKIMGQKKDDIGVLIESTLDKPKEFAMAWQFEGDQNATRHLFTRCTVGRSSVAGKTKEDAIEPQTEELNLNALGRIDNNIVKLKCSPDSAAYETWLEKPYEPSFTATEGSGQ